jgi:hypothetical protein
LRIHEFVPKRAAPGTAAPVNQKAAFAGIAFLLQFRYPTTDMEAEGQIDHAGALTPEKVVHPVRMEPQHRVAWQLQDLPGERFTRKRFTSSIADGNFAYSHFQDCDGKTIEFTKCNFQHCIFERCYFRNSTFVDCDFTGARFVDSNLRGSRLVMCKLEYSTYKSTTLEPKQFAANLPKWENVRAEVARSLRANAQGLGDSQSVNLFIKIETQARREHWHKAWLHNESYYQEKYKGAARLVAFANSFFWGCDDFLWGHGEKPLRIVRNILLVLAVCAVVLTFSNNQEFLDTAIGKLARDLAANIMLSCSIFFGVTYDGAHRAPWLMSVFLAAFRFVSIALLLGVLTKRLSRR